MKILVSAATKHGSTEEVAEVIGGALLRAGLDVSLRLPGEVTSLAEYDAAILGSAVYAGRWLSPMRTLIEAHHGELAARPVWLFSVGPLGDPPKPSEEPVDGAQLRALIGAREHRVFPGRLLRSNLGLGERTVVGLLRAPDGDFRPMSEIEEWATGVAAQLVPVTAAPSTT